MSVVTRVRFALARRPWIRWMLVVALALTVAQIVRNTDADLARARDQWDETRTVLVATEPHAPGQGFVVEEREYPVVAVPPGSVLEIPSGSITRRHLGAGQVVVDEHLTGGSGPTALAEAGQVVVAVAHAGSAPPPIGTRVQIVGEGIVLSTEATVVGVDGDITWVAVPEFDAPVVADGVRRNLVSLVLVP